jgi:hypothetical protein
MDAPPLKAIGQKPISALVDITNFVSIDLGRPLHVYDKAKLRGGLVARKAKDGEQVLALNGKTYTLDETMTVIADDAAVHDIGGIMGGEHSGVSDTTTDVLIECAYFDARPYRAHRPEARLTSDARQRFERGVDPAFLDDGLAIATRLVLEHCGGTASASRAPARRRSRRARRSYDPGAPRTLGGLDVPPIASGDPRASASRSMRLWDVTVPSWRRDVDGSADLVEEVVRIEGIDKVPSTPLPRARASPSRPPRPSRSSSARHPPRGRRARAQRSGDVELHQPRPRPRRSAAGRGPRQPDQRGHEGHAAVAAAGPARGGARNLNRGARACACSRSAAAIWPMPSARRSAWCWRAKAARAAGRRARRAVRRVRRQGRGAGAARRGRRAGRESAGDGRGRRGLASRPVRHAAARAEDGAGGVRRWSIRSLLKAFDLDGRSRRSSSISMRSRASAATASCARPMRRPRCRR